ncbi:MAG: DUF3102 domain-containing protein, partial [Planctomycetales bacterium]|nr:DUF3102 domain-containing protein [Planctomycetales bacterium]
MSDKLDKLTREINTDYDRLIDTVNEERTLLSHFRDRKQMELQLKVRLGKRLTAVKSIVGHGKFTPWLDASTKMSHRSANRCMQLYR